MPPAAPSPETLRLQTAFRIILVLGVLVLALGGVAGWLGWRLRTNRPAGLIQQVVGTGNLIRKKFPEVDFTRIYPGLTPERIDRLQRESLAVRYAYAPFVEFAPLPTKGEFMNVTPAGFREGRAPAPWPPAKSDWVVFVFGGSTTMGFGVADGDTVVSALESSLAQKLPGRTVRCYNFGRGYYFSTQERELFASLLERGFVPSAAIFIDGLNEFVYPDGVPQLAPALFHFTAPDFPTPERTPPASDSERAIAVAELIGRYRQNIRLTEALGRAFGVTTIFVGQPVPFLDFPVRPSTYPFASTFAEHQLAGWGYARFKQAGKEGQFGERFVWCGNAFAHADAVMYADSIHYSPAGARVLAQCIVDRAFEVSLLP